ncbi:MAG: DUF3102 domain-containing protein [Clostridiales bacterium]
MDIDTNAIHTTTQKLTSTERPIETITQEIQYYKTQVGSGIIELGKRLIEAKRVLPQGEWLLYLKDTVEFSERTAQNFMRIAKEYANPQLVTDLGTAKAVCLLALTDGERAEAIETTHEINGEEKTVFEMTKKEVETLTREISEERKKAETLKFEWDEKLKESEEKHLTELEAKNEQLNTLKKELENLENQEPPTVIAELDEESLERMKKEVEETAFEEYAKKEAALMEQIREAEKAVKIAKASEDENLKKIEAAEAKAAALATAVEKAEKELIMAATPEITEFKVHFESCKNEMENMKEIIYYLRDNEKSAEADKLTKAISALCDQIKNVINS